MRTNLFLKLNKISKKYKTISVALDSVTLGKGKMFRYNREYFVLLTMNNGQGICNEFIVLMKHQNI